MTPGAWLTLDCNAACRYWYGALLAKMLRQGFLYDSSGRAMVETLGRILPVLDDSGKSDSALVRGGHARAAMSMQPHNRCCANLPRHGL